MPYKPLENSVQVIFLLYLIYVLLCLPLLLSCPSFVVTSGVSIDAPFLEWFDFEMTSLWLWPPTQALKETAERLEGASDESQEKLTSAFEIAGSLRKLLEDRESQFATLEGNCRVRNRWQSMLECFETLFLHDLCSWMIFVLLCYHTWNFGKAPN